MLATGNPVGPTRSAMLKSLQEEVDIGNSRQIRRTTAVGQQEPTTLGKPS
jgi:hypothetical protein